ncbi:MULTISPECIES: hypothetical protein [Pseudomonas syringae group]|uniref:Uncharacterized protein n=5 Tax=Pseudomonas syringae group TaxID=136849 RepID=A0AAJ4BAN7_PSESX|nr:MULTISPECIES: hypothetical protein [Pseudomonas syringae group]MBI6674365.1 hypothetical protein [Pseudomonas syringae]MBS7433891.1 hypothetical protein [Pseudomonas syringae]MBS7461325.1 hypothetical protein [Pseudomonas syringae]MCF9019301.1 hypothetical protein [Pseudomonas syringae]MEE4133232.1 hypothetical protein [Pseudomonas viridiflava]
MSWDDYIDTDYIDLPEEAVIPDAHPFEPNDEWLSSAQPEHQLEAMKRWFQARFVDPAQETPYDGGEGGYQFIHGGPYDPDEELQDRFGNIVEYGVIEQLVNELYSEVGDEWAPADWEPDYDEALAMVASGPGEPYQMLCTRLDQIRQVASINGNFDVTQVANQLAHAGIISALEAYLSETVTYWANEDEYVFRDLVSSIEEFQKAKLSVSDIFKEMEGLHARLEKYLQDLVWHRFEKVRSLMQRGLKITIPDIGFLMKEVEIRHDIIHRGGRDKQGRAVVLTGQQVSDISENVKVFAAYIEQELAQRFESHSAVDK